MRFAIATRDEVWLRGRLVEQRLSCGESFETERGFVATDARDETLIHACDAAMQQLRTCVRPDVRMRLVGEARLDGVTSTITATLGEHAIVTDAEHLDAHLALLWSAATPVAALTASPEPKRRLASPHSRLLWRNGSGAVLLHEAVGHPAEHAQPPIELPQWLEVENPLTMRRASHRDVPLLRMNNLIARQRNAPFDLPKERIEVLLVDGGFYDPLTETVTIRIAAADLVEGDRVQRIAPFTIRDTRANIIQSLTGASGEPLRYPGVICSREGQELVVGSHAPLLLTRHA